MPDPTTDDGALNILPLSAQFNASCEDAFQAGQQVEVQGDGYEPGALVTITLASPGSASAEDGFADVLGTITADSTGSIDTDVTIPPSATGFSISSGAANAVSLRRDRSHFGSQRRDGGQQWDDGVDLAV